MAKQRIAGVSFEHTHMGDLLREAHGLLTPRSSPSAMRTEAHGRGDRQFRHSPRSASITTSSSVSRRRGLISPSSVRRRRACRVAEKVAAFGVDISWKSRSPLRSPTPTGCSRRRRKSGVRLAINWPLRWYPPHVTTKRLIDEGAIGDVARSPFLRRQPRAAVSSRRQGRGLAKRRSGARSRRRGGTRRPPAAAACSTISAMARRSGRGSWTARRRSR